MIMKLLGLPAINIIESLDDHTPMGTVGLAFKGWQKGEMTDEHRKNLSIAASKRKRTVSHLEKLHAGRRGNKNSREHEAAIKAARVGSKHSDEAKNKMSIAKKGKESTKAAAINAGKISAQKRANNPLYKQQQSEKMKLVWAKRKEGIVNGD